MQSCIDVHVSLCQPDLLDEKLATTLGCCHMDRTVQREDGTSTGVVARRYPRWVSLLVTVVVYLAIAALIVLVNWDHVLLLP